jgi:hypothetical protein
MSIAHHLVEEFSHDLESTLAGFQSLSLESFHSNIALARTIFGEKFHALLDPAFIKRTITSHLQV